MGPSLVTGKHVIKGLAIREKQFGYSVDAVYTKKTFVSFQTEEQAVLFTNAIKDFIPFHDAEIFNGIKQEPMLIEYLSNLSKSIKETNESVKPSKELLTKAQFLALGGNAGEKAKVFEEAMNELNNLIGLG